MNLNKAIASITPNGQTKTLLAPIERTLPDNEVQSLIHAVCFEGLHRDHLFSKIGKLVSCYSVPHSQLITNAFFFEQYISPDSETLQRKTVTDIIKEHEKDYANQLGTRPISKAPAGCFPDEFYNNLDPRLKIISDQIPDHRKKDVAMIGIITAMSAAAAWHRFNHGTNGDVKEYSPHIHSLVAGVAGSGKGNTRHGITLLEIISMYALKMRKEAMIHYKEQKAEYDRQKKQRDKNAQNYDGLVEPERPKKYGFLISISDTTQAALVEMLYENPIGCYGYDSEVDTLVQSNGKKDFGGFSDILRKAYHHEMLSRQRKGEGESYNVPQPRLAICLSGTPDQLKKLITSEYNGLFSRFWFYIIPPAFQEYEPGVLQEDIVGEMCRSLSAYVMERADLWSGELVQIRFTGAQERELKEALQDKKDIEDRYGGDVSASWLRMALIVKRIAVTLAWFEGATGEVPESCWRAAIALLPAIKSHNLSALEIVRTNQGKADISREKYDECKKQGLSDEAISELLDVGRSTLARRKKQWGL